MQKIRMVNIIVEKDQRNRGIKQDKFQKNDIKKTGIEKEKKDNMQSKKFTIS